MSVGSQRRRHRHLAAPLLGACLISLAGLVSAPTPASASAVVACPSSPVACDSFNRTVSGGWGTADVGGSWSATGSRWAVAPGSGTVIADQTAPSSFLNAVSVRDVDTRVMISPPPISSAQWNDDGVVVRHVAATPGTWYQVNAFYNTASNNGNYTVQLKRKPDDTRVRPDFPTSVPGGQPYWLRLQAVGANPTTLRWKIWSNTAVEPGPWTDSGTDSTAAEQVAGGVGVIAYVDSGTSNVAFNSVQVTAAPPLPPPPPPPPPTIFPCPSSAVTCDSFNRTVANGWGAADVGGAWSGTGGKYAVTPGSGTIIADPTTPSTFLNSASVQDLDARVLISPPPISSAYNDDGLAARYVAASGTWYQLNAYYATGNNNGNYTVQLKRKPGVALINPDFNTNLPGGQPYWLRLQAVGVNPTSLHWKIWLKGSVEPPAWTDSGLDGTLAEQAAGKVGVTVWTNTGTSTVAFNSVQVVALPPDGVVMDGWGGLHVIGSVNTANSPFWNGWRIARGVAVLPSGSGGYTLDGWGVVHPWGAATGTLAAAWPGQDIARAIAINPCDPSGNSGYVLDEYGRVHQFGGAPAVTTNHVFGWDIARAIALNPCSGTVVTGYVLDGWGGVNGLSSGPPIPDAAAAAWPGWDIARGIAVSAGGQGYVLDGLGGVHPFGGAPVLGGTAYWPNWDIARGLTLLAGGSGGYVLDGWGGVHPFGAAPAVASPAYWPGWDIAQAIGSG